MKQDWVRIASVDVDPQRGFSKLCPDELPVEGALDIVPALRKHHAFSEFKVVTKDSHPVGAMWETDEQHPILTPVIGIPDVDLCWPRHCVVGTPGWELLPGLPPDDDYDMVVYKGISPVMHPYGACYHDLNDRISTGLIETLRDRNTDIVLLGGLATDYCVWTTARQLLRGGLKVLLNMEAVAAVDPTNNIKVINDLSGWVNFNYVENTVELERFLRIFIHAKK